MSDITGQNPDYTDADLAILSSGAWGAETEEPVDLPPVSPDDFEDDWEEDTPEEVAETPEEPEESRAQAPQNPWAEPAEAEAYAKSKTTKEPVLAAGKDMASRVELQPGGVKAAIEAVLAVADVPVSARELSAALIVSESTVEAALDELYRDYNGYDDGEKVHEPRGFELRRIAGGWRLYARADFSPWVGRFIVGKTSAKLPRAVMETLTVIAYRQPVTRNYVASVRGVSVDSAFKTLMQRGLITETVPDAETGANQYITTDLLLEKLGLNSLQELPPLAPFLPEADDIELASENN